VVSISIERAALMQERNHARDSEDRGGCCTPPSGRAISTPIRFAQFSLLVRRRQAAITDLPETMMLATATREGEVSVRACCSKKFDRRGFAFYTNYNSRKAAQIHDNPRAALAFWWPALERQVRIEGAVVRVTEDESNAYSHRGPEEVSWARGLSEQRR